MTAERVAGVCKHDEPHAGRCTDGLGGSWDNNHPVCPDCVRWRRWGATAIAERDQAVDQLAALRRAVTAVLAASPLGEAATILAGLPADDFQPADWDALERARSLAAEVSP